VTKTQMPWRGELPRRGESWRGQKRRYLRPPGSDMVADGVIQNEKTHPWTPQTPRSDALRPARLLWTHIGDNGESPLVVLEFSAFSALRSQWS
jgi:hypothetical protein